MSAGAPDELISNEQIAELITRRRRQSLVHSVIYYELNRNLVIDAPGSRWSRDLDRLQRKYPEIAAKCPFADAFKEFDFSSGFNLPLRDPWAVRTAQYLVKNFEGGYPR